jgi:hypothetical protein
MKLVGDEIGGVETFMKRFKVSVLPEWSRHTCFRSIAVVKGVSDPRHYDTDLRWTIRPHSTA